MELNQFTIGIGLIILVGVAAVYLYAPSLSPTALVSSAIPPSNPFVGKVTGNIDELFRDKPQAVIEQDDRTGLLLPGGNSVQFANDGTTTDKDVVIIINATTAKISSFKTYPDFVEGEFTYVPASELVNENPYVRAQYPNGFFMMAVNIEG